MTNLSEKAKKFLAKNPTLIAVIGTTKFYEHPELGDESPLIEIRENGKIMRSVYWDIDSAHDDFIDSLIHG